MNKYGLYLLLGVIIYNLIDYIYIYIYTYIDYHLGRPQAWLKVLFSCLIMNCFFFYIGLKCHLNYFVLYIYLKRLTIAKFNKLPLSLIIPFFCGIYNKNVVVTRLFDYGRLSTL